jgi:phage baseplate assembly protein W
MAIQTSAHIDAQGTNISTKTTKIWKDINLKFDKHPETNDLARVFDVESIKRSVKNLILTDYGERPFQPWIGSNIRGLLFEQMDNQTVSGLRSQIMMLLENFEPRVILTSLEINDIHDDNNRLRVTLYFTLINSPSGEIYTLDTFLDRIK